MDDSPEASEAKEEEEEEAERKEDWEGAMGERLVREGESKLMRSMSEAETVER